MHTVESPDTGFIRYLPENLAECDRVQYIELCGLLFEHHAQKITHEEFLCHAVYKLMNMKARTNKSEEIEQSKSVNVVLLQELIENSFFTKTEHEDGTYELKIIQEYIDNPVPHITPLLTKYYGPSDAFNNVKFGEYIDAQKLFHQFNATGEVQILYELAATLYRQKKAFHFIKKRLTNYDGDVRQKYNSNFVESRIKTFKYAPIGFIYGLYLYFASFQIILSSGQIPWGDKILDLSIIFSGPTAPDINIPDIGLDSVAFSMAESGIFGDYDKVRELPFWTVIIKMYDARIKQLIDEKQQEDAKDKSPS